MLYLGHFVHFLAYAALFASKASPMPQKEIVEIFSYGSLATFGVIAISHMAWHHYTKGKNKDKK